MSAIRHVFNQGVKTLCSREINKNIRRAHLCLFIARSMVTVVERGSFNTPNYRLYFKDETGVISPFHDIPLYADKSNNIFNMVVEVPRWTNAKMEIATKEPLNPIKQDVKKDKLRFVDNCFPHHGYIWNYGAIPQTWENPESLDEATGCKGDNDPIDVCEIGYRVAKRGDIVKVKVLGVMALIDEGETDWKIIAIDVNDPLASQLNDIEDVEKHMPGFLKATHEWFRIYKIPSGKPENKFAFNGEAKNKESKWVAAAMQYAWKKLLEFTFLRKEFALKIIEETHKYWEGLIKGTQENKELSKESVTVEGSPHKISRAEASEVFSKSAPPGPATPIEPSVDKWHYIRL